MLIEQIFVILLIAVGIALGIYLIVSLKKINSTLDILERDLRRINEKLEPILDNIIIITDKAVNISNETEKRIIDISKTIQNVRNTVSKFSIKGKHSSDSRSPIQDLLSNLNAFSKGFSAFWRKLNN